MLRKYDQHFHVLVVRWIEVVRFDLFLYSTYFCAMSVIIYQQVLLEY